MIIIMVIIMHHYHDRHNAIAKIFRKILTVQFQPNDVMYKLKPYCAYFLTVR